MECETQKPGWERGVGRAAGCVTPPPKTLSLSELLNATRGGAQPRGLSKVGVGSRECHRLLLCPVLVPGPCAGPALEASLNLTHLCYACELRIRAKGVSPGVDAS